MSIVEMYRLEMKRKQEIYEELERKDWIDRQIIIDSAKKAEELDKKSPTTVRKETEADEYLNKNLLVSSLFS